MLWISVTLLSKEKNRTPSLLGLTQVVFLQERFPFFLWDFPQRDPISNAGVIDHVVVLHLHNAFPRSEIARARFANNCEEAGV